MSLADHSNQLSHCYLALGLVAAPLATQGKSQALVQSCRPKQSRRLCFALILLNRQANMKKNSPYLVTTFSLMTSMLSLTAYATDYNPYPKAGVYDGSDKEFERTLTIKADGKFTLEVLQKVESAHMHSGSGSGRLNDAPGGWDFNEGRCSMKLSRAMGGMQMKVSGCSSSWGDVPYDAKYSYAGDLPAPAPAAAIKANPNAAKVAAAAPASVAIAAQAPATPAAAPGNSSALPTRKELLANWSNVMVDGIAGKSVLMFAKSAGSVSKESPLERFSQAAFFIDTEAFYNELPAAKLSKTPLAMLEISLPTTAASEGLSFRGDCVFGKYDKVVVIHIDSYHKTKGTKSKAASAWMLDNKLQLQEIKPVSKVKCPAMTDAY